MAYKKIGTLSVSIGEYTDSQGNKKYNRKNIGTRWKNEEGKVFYRLDPTMLSMQLFALCNKERKPDVMVSYFEEKEAQGDARPATNIAKSEPEEGVDDEIPF